MSRRTETIVDKLIEPAVKEIAARPGYFTKREVVAAVLQRRDLGQVLREIRSKFVGYGIDELVVRYIEGEVGKVLQQRDAYGIRLYECYAAEPGVYRWRAFKRMTLSELDEVIESTRTQVQKLNAKLAQYEIFREALAKRPGGTRIESVYEAVVRRLSAAA